MNGKVIGIIALVALAALLVAFGPPPKSDGDGNTLHVVATTAPDSIDSGVSYLSMSWQIQVNVYNGLLTYRKVAGDTGTELVPDLADRQTFACGPVGLLEALERHHESRGLALLTEQFRVNRVVVGEGGTVSFAGSGVRLDADGATPILEAAEQAGVLMPSGCRMGICYSCVLPLREGAVRDLRTGEVTTASEGDGVVVQTCINAAAGDCTIDH